MTPADFLRMLAEGTTSGVVMAIGLAIFWRRSVREEVERKALFARQEAERLALFERQEAERKVLFERVLHGDGNGQAGLKEIGSSVREITSTMSETSRRVGQAERRLDVVEQVLCDTPETAAHWPTARLTEGD